MNKPSRVEPSERLRHQRARLVDVVWRRRRRSRRLLAASRRRAKWPTTSRAATWKAEAARGRAQSISRRDSFAPKLSLKMETASRSARLDSTRLAGLLATTMLNWSLRLAVRNLQPCTLLSVGRPSELSFRGFLGQLRAHNALARPGSSKSRAATFLRPQEWRTAAARSTVLYAPGRPALNFSPSQSVASNLKRLKRSRAQCAAGDTCCGCRFA